jgi:CBS domain-containing protein
MNPVLEGQNDHELIEPVGKPVRAARERTFSLIESYPYRHRVRDIMRAPVQTITADAPVRDTLSQLLRR